MLARTGASLSAFVLCLGLLTAVPEMAEAATSKAKAKVTKVAKAKAKSSKKAVKPAEVEPEPPATVSRMANWVARSGDNQDMPFVIIDKAAARVFVYGPDGELRGQTPALIGLTPGDDAVPGVGDRELSDIPPEDRTTPAGRFVGGYGPADGGRRVLWVDYATAISIHPVVTTNAAEKRVERLKSPEVDDNSITFGCINVSRKFYTNIVRPAFKETNGVFYVLPDQKDLAELFPSFWQSEFAAKVYAGPVNSAP